MAISSIKHSGSSDSSSGGSPPSRHLRRVYVYFILATGISSALVFIGTPPGYLSDQIRIRPWQIGAQLLGVFAASFVLIVLGGWIVSWATRKPRTLREGGFVSFSTSLISGLFAITLWLAYISVLVAPVGILFGALTLYEERKDGQGHSLVNLVGLFLNLIALGVYISQIITATVWK